ncbi:DUF3870 domain-containing protein [Pelosinus fermentans]|uniref:DUF3870 domain-containing protein n=1 Tax=Pelosinus fermentans JBW45 TaxID=1192197 RepID=I9NT68_9FIRM|nr:DUF3870 domain-containing protein [Pelosinus fermentans]AJQ26285.1 protein of unknown function DUF3870 [Pelosinus fermentans JBW45]
MFGPNTICIVGDAKSPQNDAVTHQYGRFSICFVVDKDSGNIITCSSTFAISLTNDFITTIFSNKSLTTDGEIIRVEVENRYFGASQKAIIVAFKDAQKKYNSIKKGIHVQVTE